MKSLIILLIVNISLKNYAYAQSYKKCLEKDPTDCLHAQGLYTDEELDLMAGNLEVVEKQLAQDKDSQIYKYAHKKSINQNVNYANINFNK